jgi:hypothetical protein
MLVAIGGVRYLPDKPDEPEEPEGLLTALTTEHFTLQGARSATTSESSARTALYLGAVSSVLISIGFVSGDSALLPVFTLVVLPTVFLLGIATFVRLVELGVEDFIYGRAINRIRAHYRQLAGPYARLFLLRGNDDALGVMRNMGLRRAGPLQLLFTFATAIAVVNSVIGGAAVATFVRVMGASLGAAVAVGGLFAVLVFGMHLRHQLNRQNRSSGLDEVLFPSEGNDDSSTQP